MITLTDEERAKFAAYCYQEAETFKGMAEQMGKLNMGVMTETFVKRERNKAVAFALVGTEIDPNNWERMST